MALKTTVTELSDSRVRLDAEVPSEELESRVQRTAAQLGRDLRIPGFRKGKVPGPMVIQRIGRDAVLEQAVRDSLPEWYEEAIVRSGISTVGDPKLDLDDLPSTGEPLSFSIEVGVTPKATLGKYREPRGRQALAGGAGRGDPDRARPAARVLRAAGQRRSRGARRRPPGDRLRRPRRRRGVQGRRGARLHARDRRRAADRGLRGAARRRARRRLALRRDRLPGRVPGRGAEGPARRVRRAGQGREGEAAARSSTTTSPREASEFDTLESCGRHPPQARARAGALDRGRVPPGRRGRRRGGGGARPPRRARHGARARRCGSAPSAS